MNKQPTHGLVRSQFAFLLCGVAESASEIRMSSKSLVGDCFDARVPFQICFQRCLTKVFKGHLQKSSFFHEVDVELSFFLFFFSVHA